MLKPMPNKLSEYWIGKTEIRYNEEWLSKISLKDLIYLASNFTIQQFMARQNFRQRWENEEALYFHEFFYALMQGYDAYALDADVQVGGTDQMFNIITAARKIMTYYGKKPNIGVILGILPWDRWRCENEQIA